MNITEKNKRLTQAIKQHEALLNKELSYSEDLQNKDVIARHVANIAKVKAMIE
jgi:hypothetical protein